MLPQASVGVTGAWNHPVHLQSWDQLQGGSYPQVQGLDAASSWRGWRIRQFHKKSQFVWGHWTVLQDAGVAWEDIFRTALKRVPVLNYLDASLLRRKQYGSSIIIFEGRCSQKRTDFEGCFATNEYSDVAVLHLEAIKIPIRIQNVVFCVQHDSQPFLCPVKSLTFIWALNL